MAKKTQTETRKQDLSMAFVKKIDELPKRTRKMKTYDWLEQAPKGAYFSSFTLDRAGIYASRAVAAATLIRLKNAGLLKETERAGVYQKA